MHVVRAFVGVHGLQVGGVPHHLKFGRDAVAAVHVAGDARDIQRLAAIVALDEADGFRDQLMGFEAPANAQRSLEAQRDLGRHVRELELDQLVGGEGLAELLAVERVLPRRAVAGFR